MENQFTIHPNITITAVKAFIFAEVRKYLIILLASISWQINAQDTLFQFTGAIFDKNDQAIPFVTVINLDKNIGQISNSEGIFSLVVSKLDTISFSYVGYKTQFFVIPDSIEGSRYSKLILLGEDTIILEGTTIRPWPEREKFRQAFLDANPPGGTEQIASHAGFIKRSSPPVEPKPTFMNPVSLIFDKLAKWREKRKKKKKAKDVPVWNPSE